MRHRLMRHRRSSADGAPGDAGEPRPPEVRVDPARNGVGAGAPRAAEMRGHVAPDLRGEKIKKIQRNSARS